MIGSVLFPLMIIGCGTDTSDPAPITGERELLQDHGFAEVDAQQIIDHLESLPVVERPRNLIASVTATSLQLREEAGREAKLPLPQGLFYLSVAPFVETTHVCAFHSLTTCLGELRNREISVNVVDSGSGDIIEEGTHITHDNGFIGFWLPRAITAKLTCTVENFTGSASFSTQAEDDLTCLTSLRLR